MADATVTIRGGAGNAVQIQGRAVPDIAPTSGQALAWDSGDSAWEPQTISGGGSSEWTDTGSVLHPSEETVDNVVVGGTTTGNSDIVLGVDGHASFNDQSGNVDFNIKSANQAKMFHVDGTNDTVGIGCDPVEAGASNPSALLVVSNRGTASTPAEYSPLIVENDAAASYINVISNDDGWQGVLFGDQTDPDEASIKYNATNKRMYFTGNGEAISNNVLTVDHSANVVGVNVGAPSNGALDVDGTVAIKEQGSVASGVTGYAMLTPIAWGNDAKTKLLLHCDGANDGALFPDSATGGSATISINSVVTKTATKKFGTASGYFSGSAYLGFGNDVTDFEMGSGNFTVECWFNTTAGGSTYANALLTNGNSAASTSNWKIYCGEYVNGFLFAGSTGHNVVASTATDDGAWHHVALVRNGPWLKLFIDGRLEDVENIGAAAMNASATATFNAGLDHVVGTYYTGYMDEIAVTKGEAKYLNDFTPQKAAFPITTLAIVTGDGGAHRLGLSGQDGTVG